MNWIDFKIVNFKKNMILIINWNVLLNVIKNRIRFVGYDVNRYVDVNVFEFIFLFFVVVEYFRFIFV